jgi:hypothetical protein
MIFLHFEDPQLKLHFEKVISVMSTLPDDLRPICALLDAWHWFSVTEGEQSPRACEAVRHLSSQELRSALKAWYLRASYTNVAIDKFRHTLEQAIGEELPLGKK